MKIRLQGFRGEMPGIDPWQLPENGATVAVNCDFRSGALQPWRNSDVVSGTLKEGTIKSLFYYQGVHWLSFTQDTDFVVSPVPGDAFGRLYFTEAAGPPKMLIDDSSMLVEPAPSGTPYTLGIPAPAAAPTLGTPSGGDVSIKESRAYVVTCVSSCGEEGAPSPASEVIEMNNGGEIVVNLPAIPEGNFSITKKNIYRTNTGSSTTEFQFVAQVDANITTYTDSIASSALSEVLPTTTWEMPRADMIGLCCGPGGMVAGFSGNRVCFCVPWYPHAWPRDYEVSVSGNVTAIGWVGSSLVVLSGGVPTILTGTPGSMSEERLDIGYACSSKRGVVDIGGALVYPSPVGLIMISAGEVKIATAGIFTKEEWEKISPSTITAYQYGESYVGFYNNGTDQQGFVLSADGNFSFLDFYATAGHYDHVNGHLYLVIDGALHLFDGGATRLQYQWRSRPYSYNRIVNFGAGIVRSDSYPVQVNFYVDDSLLHTQQVVNYTPFRLPGIFGGYKTEFEFIGAGRMSYAEFAESIMELIN